MTLNITSNSFTHVSPCCLFILPTEHLNEKFISFLLDGIENPVSDEIPDTFLKLILSFNLHFEMPDDNIIMKVLEQRGTAKRFTELLMLLVNRQGEFFTSLSIHPLTLNPLSHWLSFLADDPVRMFDHEPRPPNSLLKFMSDLYSNPRTSNLLYRNDAMVLIDIVLRQLRDLGAGDGVRKSIHP